MTPLWLLLTPQEMAVAAAGVIFLGCPVVAALLVEVAHHNRSTVDPSASGDAAPSGADRWVAESEREECPAHLPRDGQRLAVVAGPSATPTPT